MTGSTLHQNSTPIKGVPTPDELRLNLLSAAAGALGVSGKPRSVAHLLEHVLAQADTELELILTALDALNRRADTHHVGQAVDVLRCRLRLARHIAQGEFGDLDIEQGGAA